MVLKNKHDPCHQRFLQHEVRDQGKYIDRIRVTQRFLSVPMHCGIAEEGLTLAVSLLEEIEPHQETRGQTLGVWEGRHGDP